MSGLREDYLSLMRAFLSGAVSAPEFQTEFLGKFQAETRPIDEPTYQILDGLFADVDAFCDDDELRRQLEADNPGWALDEQRLRQRVHEAARRLSA